MSDKNDLISITNYLQEQNISLDFEEFEFQVSSHPDFPSLLAYSDALTFFKTPNIATRIDKEQIDFLPDSFLALVYLEEFSEAFTHVKRKGSQFLCSFGKEKKALSREEFLEAWQDVILLAEQGEEVQTSQNVKKSNSTSIALAAILVSLLSFGLYTWWNGMAYSDLAFFGLTIVGIFLSGEALKQNLGIDSPTTSRFCSASPVTSCESVINSKKSGLFKIISLTDVCILFFSVLMINFIGFYFTGAMNQYFTVLATGMWLILPVGFYSVYFQWRIEKSWCPICLTILGVVLIQALLVYLTYGNLLVSYSVPYAALGGFAVSLLLISGFWYLIKPTLFDNKSLKEFQLKALRFKKNFKLFSMALSQEEEVVHPDGGYPLAIGNDQAALKIHFLTNPYCKHCRDAHSVVEHILLNYGDQVHLTLGFNFPATDFKQFIETEPVAKERVFLHRTLISIYREEGSKQFMKALGDWFQDKDIKAWERQYTRELDNTDLLDAILDAQDEWHRVNELKFTPTVLIGNRKFPTEHYDVEDIKYFVNDLLEEQENE